MGVLLVFTLAILIVLIYFVIGLIVRMWFTKTTRSTLCPEFPRNVEDRLSQRVACLCWPGVLVALIVGIVWVIQGKEPPKNPFDDIDLDGDGHV